MAGEIQIGGTTFATESGGTVTVSNVDTATNRTNLGLGSMATQDSDSITVTGGTATLGALTVSGSDSGDLVRITQTGSGNALVVEDSANPDSTPFVVDSSGNVGIGTSPSERLDVVVNETANSRIHTDLGGISNKFVYLTIDSSETYDDSRAVLQFSHDGTASASIQNNYRSATGISDSLTIRTFEASPIIFIPNNSEAMRIDSSGNLLVGYTSSNGSYKLQVNSQIYATSSTIATSDFNYKENITPLDGALSLVSQLNPVQFDWKEHSIHEFDRNQPTIGFIAQEVQQVLSDQPYVNSIVKSNECIIEPEEVDEEGNVIKEAVTEEFLGIAEGNMIALLTKAIQEQQTLIESQQSQIDALTARIEALETT